jgi:Recombination endonuclease VII
MDQLTAKCTKCHTFRDASWFSFDCRRVSGLTPWCKPCLRAAQRLYRTGLSPGEFEALLRDQDGKCGICGATFGQDHPMRIDRSRAGTVRGLLCARCKVGVNTFQEDVGRIRMAAEYLARASN